MTHVGTEGVHVQVVEVAEQGGQRGVLGGGHRELVAVTESLSPGVGGEHHRADPEEVLGCVGHRHRRRQEARLVDEGGRQVEHHPEGVGAVGDDLADGAGLRAVDHHRGTVDDTAGDHGGAHGDVEPVVGDESIDQGREERDDHGDDEEDPSAATVDAPAVGHAR